MRPGDELCVESEVLEVCPSRSRPIQGLIKMRAMLNQNGEAVQINFDDLPACGGIGTINFGGGGPPLRREPNETISPPEGAAHDEPGGPVIVHTLTRERPPPGWRGHARRIDAPMLAKVGFPPAAAPKVFVCGPTPMVEAVAEALVGLGHESARVKTERFGASGGG